LVNWGCRVVVQQDTPRRPIQIVILIGPQAPQEGEEAKTAKGKGHRYQDGEDVHDLAFRDTRKALSNTVMEEVDIAMAAKSGVTNPARASGMTKAL
jgi:hypothetical protein